MAIVAATKDENGEDVQLLDSFGSSKHILNEKELQRLLSRQLRIMLKPLVLKKLLFLQML